MLAPNTFASLSGEIVLNVPAYLWRGGCGPTALGMVIGFYDEQGYGLIPGSAITQTEAVDQVIASNNNLWDYGDPEDAYPILRVDDYITSKRPPHQNDCLADFALISRSTNNNYFGWGWARDIGPAFVSFVNSKSQAYSPNFQVYQPMTWNVLMTEIDKGRPMLFLVDVDANGQSDHFVTVIGYRDNPKQYASHDTWYTAVRWENFTPIARGTPWGIYGGWALRLEGSTYRVFLPVVSNVQYKKPYP